jgi:pimeloyl-ACP methyl ester carboxylesterase
MVSRKVFWFFAVLACLLVTAGVGFYLHPLGFFNELLYLQMSTSGAHSRWITVNGIRIHYYEQGPESALPVVLVHGLGGHAEDWRNLRPYIVTSGHRIYMLDLPGYGRSEWPQNYSYSVPDETNTIVAFMDALGLRRVDLGGFSMGGWIAQRVAIDHPDRVRSLMIFDSAGLYDRPNWNTALFTPTSAAELDQLDALLMPHPPQVPAFIARDVLRYSRGHAWVIHRALDSMLTGKDVTDAELPHLKMPVLIVWGAEDHIVPLADGQKMHQLIPQSQLDIVPGCGHLAPVQCPYAVGPKVQAFLSK